MPTFGHLSRQETLMNSLKRSGRAFPETYDPLNTWKENAGIIQAKVNRGLDEDRIAKREHRDWLAASLERKAADGTVGFCAGYPKEKPQEEWQDWSSAPWDQMCMEYRAVTAELLQALRNRKLGRDRARAATEAMRQGERDYYQQLDVHLGQLNDDTEAGCIEKSGVISTNFGDRLHSQKVRDDRKDYEAVKADFIASYRDGSMNISEKRLDKHGNEVLDNNGNVIIDNFDFMEAYQKAENDPVRQLEMEQAVEGHRLKLFGRRGEDEPDPVQLPGQGKIFVECFGRRSKEYLKYMFGDGGIYAQLTELKMPEEDVLLKALTFLDPLQPGKSQTVQIKSFAPPAVRDSWRRQKEAAKRSKDLEAGIKEELKVYFGWLEHVAREVEEDTQRPTRSVPGAEVKLQKIYRSEKDKTLLKQKIVMKTPDFYWRNLDEMKSMSLDKNTGQMYGPYWRKRAEKGTFKMREREKQYYERLADNLKRIENADHAACVPGSHVEGSESYPPLRLVCEQQVVTPYVEAEPARRSTHNARAQARKDQMRENTRRHMEKMQALKDLSFREHVNYERRKQH
jgi:hypothetical protein